MHFYDDVTPYDESESRAVLGLVEVNLDALLTDFHAMSHDWKRGRLMERWGVRGWSPDDFFEEIRRRHHADLE